MLKLFFLNLKIYYRKFYAFLDAISNKYEELPTKRAENGSSTSCMEDDLKKMQGYRG